MPFDELITFVRLSTLAAAVVFLLWSSAVNANPIRQSVCPPDEYFDGIGKKCVKCSLICRPDLPQDFCRNNCRDYLSSTTTMAPRDEAPRVQPVLMMTTQPSTHAVPEARQQSILPPNNDATTTSAASPSTLEVVIIAVVCVSAVAILVVVVIVVVVVVILYRMKITPTSLDAEAKEPTDQVSNNRTTTKADDVEKINNWRFGCIRSQLSSESTKGLLHANNTKAFDDQ